MKIELCIFLVLFALTVGCSGKKERPLTEKEIHETEEALIGANRMMVQKDKIKIEEYIRQNKLLLTESASGLWYGIVKKGTGMPVKANNTVTLLYEVSLLDGTKCYDSDSLGPKQFVVGKGGVESGLEEGILMLNEGSEAVFILPPHLAYGFTGDGDKIPQRTIIVYRVSLQKVEP
jgi:FKBP-type peptidyl-prolyl cis-trans isomerase FkpA